ncbi:MAG: helix-turn-helix domain-containing protein [Methylocystis sp.]|uniref:helix-turn-helix domain-containing protein n=1 Tax=Methylocystis sp. TaxID=1911079 RepID=UPI003DA3E9D9
MSQKVSEMQSGSLSVAQLRGARGLLGWSQSQLAEAAGLSLPTIKRTELETVKVSVDARERLRAALEKAGVEFIAENGGGPGVRLRKKGSKQ